MATVDDGAPPPLELEMAWKCQQWNTLPDAGGLYEQDFVLMERMRVLLNIHNALRSWRDEYSKGHNIHNAPDGVRRIVAGLRKDGYL